MYAYCVRLLSLQHEVYAFLRTDETNIIFLGEEIIACCIMMVIIPSL